MTVPIAATSCPSQLLFDRLLADEVDIEARQLLHQHLDTCPRCRETLAARREDWRSFADNHPPASMSAATLVESARRKQRRWLWRSFSVVVPLAAAASLLFSIGPVTEGDGERSKGGASFRTYARRDGAVFEVAPGSKLHPGDAIGFVFNLATPRYITVFSVGSTGEISVYSPIADGQSLLMPAGAGTSPTSSVTLDTSLGSETLVGVFCENRFTVESVRAALAVHLRAGKSPREFSPRGDCSISMFSFAKAMP